jgi:hypothetical protein
MSKYYFQTPNPDLKTIAKRLVLWFKQSEYDVQYAEDDAVQLIQAKKTGTFRTLTGTNIAFTLKLYPSDTPDEFICETATGQWTANIAGAATTALFTGGLTLVTGALGAAWAVKVERDIVDFMESTLKFRKMRTEGATPPATSATAASSPVPIAAPVPSGAASATLSPRQKAEAKVASEMKALSDAHAGGVLDAVEYAAKTQLLQAKVDEYTVAFTIEERSTKLKEALSHGIISQDEYETKLAALRTAVAEEVRNAEKTAAKDSQIARLKAARDAGVLTPDEFAQKVAALG